MTDNIQINQKVTSGSETIATDDISGVHHQRVKVQHGADGSATDVSSVSPLPVYIPSSTASTDAFGRLRVSDPNTRLDVEFIYNKQDDFVDEVTNNGTVTHNANARDLTLSISDASNGTYAEMATYPVPYTPGNSQLIEITGVLDLAGIGSGTAELFRRSSVTGSAVEEVIAQEDWSNLTSGVDWTDAHIFVIDLQSLKVGTIRYGLFQSGAFNLVAQIDNDNERNTGYWQLANAPAYWKLYNDATYTYMEVGYGNSANAVGFRYKITANASATMKAICATVKSEGGKGIREISGLARAASNAQTAVTASTTLIPILSIRPKSTFNSLANLGTVIPKSWSIQTDNPIRLALIYGGTLTNASWADVDTSNSSVEYDVSASAISGGVSEVIEYVASSGRNSAGSGSGLIGKTVLWDRQSSHTGIFTLAAVKTGASDADVFASIGWEELR